MSKIRVLPLDFFMQAGMLVPHDRHLYEAAQNYCAENLQGRPNFAEFQKVWVAAKIGDEGELLDVVGISGIRTVVDINLFRATETIATIRLGERINDYLADTGLRGKEIMLHSDSEESSEQACNSRDAVLKSWNAAPANRFTIVVR